MLLLQRVWIQALQIFWHEEAVFADELVVEIDLAAAVFWGLDENEVPMDGGNRCRLARLRSSCLG